MFEIILLAGIGYLIYRYIKKRREQTAGASFSQGGYETVNQGYQSIPSAGMPQQLEQPSFDPVDAGLNHVRQMDYNFDEERFKDNVMDNFFKIQAAWMNRDLGTVTHLLADDMRRTFQDDIDRMLRDRQTNKLENIAVRNVELVEVWQEAGQDFITTQVTANLLDYTTDDASGAVVAGSKTEPVKFDEFWTFTRPVGNNPWKLSAINQK
jgi:predicted lipid-binding transport protein (Tim44 family)